MNSTGSVVQSRLRAWAVCGSPSRAVKRRRASGVLCSKAHVSHRAARRRRSARRQPLFWSASWEATTSWPKRRCPTGSFRSTLRKSSQTILLESLAERWNTSPQRQELRLALVPAGRLALEERACRETFALDQLSRSRKSVKRERELAQKPAGTSVQTIWCMPRRSGLWLRAGRCNAHHQAGNSTRVAKGAGAKKPRQCADKANFELERAHKVLAIEEQRPGPSNWKSLTP